MYLASLVLGDLVLGVLVAVPGLAERPAGFRNVDLRREKRNISLLFSLYRLLLLVFHPWSIGENVESTLIQRSTAYSNREVGSGLVGRS